MNRWDRGIATLLVVALAVVAAGMLVRPAVRAEHPQPTAGQSQPYREGILGHPASVTPLTARTQVDRDLVALLFRGLVRMGPGGELEPDLAISWSVSADAKSYYFLLRGGQTWHDGTPVTAGDVVFTVGLLQNPGYTGPLGASWRGIKATAVDAGLVRFDLSIPLAGFLEAATLPILPSHLLASTPVETLADSDFSLDPLGDGPFRLVELDDAHALLERDVDAGGDESAFALPSLGPDVAAPSPLAPTAMPIARHDAVTTIQLSFYDDAATMLADLARGDLDALSALPLASIPSPGVPRARLIRYPQTTVTSVVLNQRPDHADLRAADTHLGLLGAIDRPALVRDVLAGYGTAAEIAMPPSSWAYQASSVTPIAYDPQSASAALVRAGWTRSPAGGWYAPGGKTTYMFELVAPDEATNPVAAATADRVAMAWRGLGLDVYVVKLPAADYLTRLSGGKFDAAVVDFALGIDPDLSPLLLSSQSVTSGSNISGIQNTALDKLLIAARTAVGRDARLAALAAVEQYLSTNQPILPLYFRDYVFVVSDRVQGVSSNEVVDPSGRYWDVLDWRLASDG